MIECDCCDCLGCYDSSLSKNDYSVKIVVAAAAAAAKEALMQEIFVFVILL